MYVGEEGCLACPRDDSLSVLDGTQILGDCLGCGVSLEGAGELGICESQERESW